MTTLKTKTRFFLSILCVTAMFVSSCSQGTTESENAVKEESSLIVDISSIVGKSPDEVGKVLGKEDSKEVIKNKYPCENKDCEKLIYNKGKYEVIFNENKPLRVTINETPDLSSDETAITKIGLPEEAPSFKNPGSVMRWSNINGIEEVNFNPSFIYIIIKK